MTWLSIAAVNLRRTARDRTNLFFMVLFPLLLIMVLGIAFGGDYAPRVAVVAPDGAPLAGRLVADLEETPGIDVRRVDEEAEARRDVEQGRATAVLTLPEDYDSALRAGREVRVRYVSRADETAQQVRALVAAVVDRQASRLAVAGALVEELRIGFDGALEAADAAATAVPDIEVETTTVGEAVFPEELDQFDISAPGMLLLFIFITSLTASTALIETRELGVSRRMYASPAPVRSIVAGEALGRVSVALVQGLVIMLGSALLFGVTWGDPVAAVALMLVFAFTAGGAGMLLGALGTSVQQAVAIGLLVALGAGALGGAMMPLEFFPPTMYAVAHVTPHAWAAEGFAVLVRHGGGLADILTEIAVLLGYGAVLFLAASWALRRALLRG